MKRQESLIFISTMGLVPWGGSEELWSRAALDFASRGFPVIASVLEWSPLHPRVLALEAGGIDVRMRPQSYWRSHPIRWLISRGGEPTVPTLKRLLGSKRPALVVISEGGSLPPVGLVEYCAENKLPFVTICQMNSVGSWCTDEDAKRYRAALPSARRCFFVSRENMAHAEKQVGAGIHNGEVVWNPVNVPFDFYPSWPLIADGEMRFASVARLYPPAKGQDILLEALAEPVWKARRWQLRFYGEGPMMEVIELLAQKLGLSDRITFAGFASVEQIWSTNHVLVMPSRYEGLPLAMVEAMLCARPVVATDVAGHRELIEDGVTGFLADAPTPASMAAALERFWSRRHEAAEIGQAGARRIRQLMPSNPVRVFSDRLTQIAGLTPPH